ncbi:YdcF family protein, partial [Bacteroidota bacterium]
CEYDWDKNAWIWFRHRSTGRILLVVTVPLLLLTAASTPAAAFLALKSLEWRFPPTEFSPPGGGTIVLLAGYVFPPDKVRPRAELSPSSIYRCDCAARLFKEGTGSRILISGGKPDSRIDGPAYSDVMGEYLERLGIDSSVLIFEDRSRNTHQSAIACAEILESLPGDRVFLVTDASHMARATACFRAQGIDVVPAACSHQATEFNWEVWTFLPSAQSLIGLETACHEWIGLLWYRLSGKLGA